MTKDIFIGVDGGGTKSKLVMRDAAGNLLGAGRSGAANIRLCVDTALHSIDEAFQQALAEAKIDRNDSAYHFHLGLGLAGTEVPEACTEFLARLPYFDTVRMESDAYAACLGAHDGADGAILIVGTGVIGYKVTKGQHKRVAGWGFPYDDVGGGAWFGLHAIRYTLEWQDGRREVSPFLEAVFQSFHNSVTTMVSWADKATATEYATLAPMVTRYLAQGDRWAIELAERSGEALCAVVDALIQGDESFPLCLFGGLASFMEGYLKANLKLNVVSRKHDATEGAILMVREVAYVKK